MKQLAIALAVLLTVIAMGVGGLFWLRGRLHHTAPEAVAPLSDENMIFPVLGFPGQGIAFKNELHVAHVEAAEPVNCFECHKFSPEQERIKHRCLRCHEENWSSVHGSVEDSQARECLTCHDFFHLPSAVRDPWACGTCHVEDERTLPEEYSGPRHLPDAPLIEQHKQESCGNCHNPHDGPAVVPRECAECHEETPTRHARTQKGRKGVEICMDCHAVHEAKDGADRHCRRCHSKDVRKQTLFRGGHEKCVDCHVPHDFTKDSTKLCNTCHDDQPTLADAKVPSHGGCEKCHTPHEPSNARGSCLTSRCHANQKLAHPKDKKLGPCLACHVVHPRRDQRNVGTLTCEGCHLKGQDATAYHRGKGKGKGKKLVTCTECHGPHKTSQPVEVSPRFCLSCHKQAVGGAAKISVMKAHEECGRCHLWAAHQPTRSRPTCESCHEEEFAQAPKDHRECQQCHDVHEGATNSQTCTSAGCHKPQEWGGHEKIDKRCLACHRAHGPKGKPHPPGCLDCHKVKQLPGLHQHSDHQTCLDCHKPHDRRVVGNRRGCLDRCHEKSANHEPAAPSCVGCHPFVSSK